MEPQSPPHSHTSLRNQIPGTVSDIRADDAIATITVEIADDVTIKSVVTEESVDRLGLDRGTEVIAAFKTTAARATSVSR
jgi:molybdate transport system regulatory protein